jgi:aminoglycoside 6'-N-acetyltransferase I
MGTKYRLAGPTDLVSVATLLNKHFRGHSLEELMAEYTSILVNPFEAVFLAFDQKKAIGVAHAILRKESIKGTGGDYFGYLEVFHTEPGVPSSVTEGLVTRCERWAEKRGRVLFADDDEFDITKSIKFIL